MVEWEEIRNKILQIKMILGSESGMKRQLQNKTWRLKEMKEWRPRLEEMKIKTRRNEM